MRQRIPLLLIGRGDRRYGVPFRRIVEVIPRVELRSLADGDDAGRPPQLIGELDYRGQPVPVLDLTRLLSGRASADRMDTRIVVVDTAEQAEEVRLLGLVAERVLDSVVKTPGDFKKSAGTSSAPYLGATTSHEGGTVQVIDVAQILDAEQRAWLLGSHREAVQEEER